MAKYIGKTPEEVGHCWGLLRMAYNERFGITLPELPGIQSEALWGICGAVEANSGDWQEIERPVDGCAVGMSRKNAIHHVGIFAGADGGKVMHCNGDQCVVMDTLQRLRFKGFRTIRFYRHKLWPHT